MGRDVDDRVAVPGAAQAGERLFETGPVIEIRVKHFRVACVLRHALDERQHAAAVRVGIVQAPGGFKH